MVMFYESDMLLGLMGKNRLNQIEIVISYWQYN